MSSGPSNSGVSDETARKQNDFATFMGVHTRMVSSIIKRDWVEPRYFYIDINAGSGSEDGFVGSPLIAMRILAESGTPCTVYCLDKEKSKTGELRTRIAGLLSEYPDYRCDWHVVDGDHHVTLPPILESISRTSRATGRRPFGLVYSDPYGCPSFKLLKHASTVDRLDRLDVLTYISATAWKRVLKSPDQCEQSRVEEHLKSLNKKTVHIREYYGCWQWSFVFGANITDYPVLRKNGFYDIGSEEGTRILTEMNFTNKELKAAGVAKRSRQLQKNLFI